ncbi:MAG: S1-like domain-containing RNA-binding protein [Verrucomicrobia bacterium]|nr:S1-like domain-containing RNA-binding protein [Verrucomicrobiota bacterium]
MGTAIFPWLNRTDMALLGKINILTVLKDAPPGLYLDGGDLGEILLPGDSIPPGAGPDDELQVFLYRDSEDRLVATTHDPLACVGDFAALRVKQIHPTIGAFLDWGLNKDLLLPMREQERRIHKGDIVVVFVFIDEVSQRIIATTRWKDHLSATPPNYSEGAPVSLLIAGESPLGYNAIVDNAHVGLLFRSELGSPLKVGDKCKGYVRNVRPDGKLDLGLDPEGYQRIAPLADRILTALRSKEGKLPVHEGSSPEDIRAAFQTSKKAFKQAIGNLYRQRLIEINGADIVLRKSEPRSA